MAQKGGSSRCERGSVLVEAALTILPFLFILFSIIEASYVIGLQHVLSQAAREAARLSTQPLQGTGDLPTTDQIVQRAQSFLATIGVSEASVAVERPVIISTGNVATEFTRVTVSLPYQVITVPVFDLNLTLTGRSLMRNETSP